MLKDGSTVELRPIKATDRDALDAFHKRQSQESIYFRFFRYRPELSDKELDYFTQVDYEDRMAFVALLGQELVAVARYERWSERSEAEVAFFVDDDHHGKGLGTLMLEYLAAAAREAGLTGFTASVLAENYRMLGVFRSAGFEVSTRFADGVIEVDIGIDVTGEASTAIADRHRLARARSVARLLQPDSVAVIGAGSRPGNVGHEVVRSLVGATGAPPFSGTVLAVNPNADEILGLPAHPTVIEAAASTEDGEIDLAVVAVRAELVERVVGQCAEAGVGGLLVISAGFGETDARGREREAHLVDLARDNGMRLIGPNAFGLVNNDPEVSLTALYHRVDTTAGRVAMASQSGPLGAALLDRLRTRRIGVSSFVGVGNRADVSVNDLLDYWHEDDRTDVVLLYVENFGNLRNFAEAAGALSLIKPTVAIVPSDPDIVDLLGQNGVIVVDEVGQLTDQAMLASTQPVPRGTRIAIVSNSASIGRLAADACRRSGLEVVAPTSVAGLDGDSSVLVGNLDTVSLMPSGEPADYERVVVAAGVSDEVDVLLIALAATTYLPRAELRGLLDRINRSIDKPVAAIGLVDTDQLVVDGLPIFAFPEEAARALGRYARYGCWLAARDGSGSIGLQQPGEEPELIAGLLSDVDERTLDLSDPELPDLLDALGLPVRPFGAAKGPQEAAAVAERLGYPVVVKATSLESRSVGEQGGAAIDLHDEASVVAAYERMSDALGPAMERTIVQRMVPANGSVRLELTQDAALGAMVTIGLGGSALQSVEPAARRFVPFDRSMAEEMVEAFAGEHINGLDDEAAEALVGLALDLGELARRSRQLVRVTLNPIMLAGTDTVPVDITVSLRRREQDSLSQVRHL